MRHRLPDRKVKDSAPFRLAPAGTLRGFHAPGGASPPSTLISSYEARANGRFWALCQGPVGIGKPSALHLPRRSV